MEKINEKIVFISIAVLFFIFSLFLGFNYYERISDVYRPTDLLQVKEQNEIIYLVHMIENDIYDEPFLEMGKTYIHDYTDFIRIHNIYTSTFNERLDASYNYEISATVIARHARSLSANTNPIIWSSRPNVIDQTTGTFNKSTTINKTMDVYLAEYKAEVERFKATVNEPIVAELRIDFIAHLEGDEERFKSEYIRSMTIPLSTAIYEIELSDNKEKTSDYNVSNENLFTVSFFANSLLIILCYIIIFFAIKAILVSKSTYKDTINKYFRTYDDIIINTDSPMNFDEYEVLMINEFKELLDLSYNSTIPIMFYENNQGGLFYIFYNNMVYLHVVKKD